MNRFFRPARPTTRSLRIIAAALLLLALAPAVAWAQTGGWSRAVALSDRPGYAWFPDLAVDPFGLVHVIYSKSTPNDKSSSMVEQVIYTRLEGDEWLEPNDIVPPSGSLARSVIAADEQNRLHLLTGGSAYRPNAITYQQAPAGLAWDSRSWSAAQPINQGISSLGDLAIFGETMHVVYDDTLKTNADIYYRRSTDGGQTWSAPLNLFSQPKTSSAKPAVRVDANGGVHVTWDEGWDLLSGATADSFHSVYIYSNDSGQTWSAPLIIAYPEGETAQLTASGDGSGGVLLVWRSIGSDERLYYQLSRNRGRTWSEPEPIEGIYARPWTVNFDSYDLLADSAGVFHLLMVGRELTDASAEQGVYHLSFDGAAWSAPEKLFSSDQRVPAQPRLALQNGSRLHAAWFTQDGDLRDPAAGRDVWYATRALDAPFIPAVIVPTATALPPTATATASPTPTTQPTLAVAAAGPQVYLEHDYISILALVIVPAVIVLGLAIAIRLLVQGARRR